MLVLGTTISLLLTITAATLMEKHQRAKDRKLSAMMVLSNIEMFSRMLDEHAEVMASTDSVATITTSIITPFRFTSSSHPLHTHITPTSHFCEEGVLVG